ncbi:hypothetical protein WJX72_000250 [[Myrmecia] bisecta]|uniref:PPPDE domain-containing protein n=1 Tax=[Myrmecia] bisecta TaxID=41462 RepID=A0AAW1PP27_9CHLO
MPPLLSDSEEEAEEPVLRVNQEFAKRLEHNKRREELHRLQAKHPEVTRRLAAQAASTAAVDTGSESSSSDGDEDEGDTRPETEAQFLAVLAKLKRRDATIYVPGQHLFPEPEESGGTPRAKPQRPLYLKDVVATQALAGATGEDFSEEEAESGEREPTYVQEQADLKRSFLQAAAADEGHGKEEDFGGVLRKRARVSASQADAGSAAQVPDTQQLLDEYFGTDKQLDDRERFLKEFIMNKGWVDREGGYVPSLEEVVEEAEEDEAYLEHADQFEAEYNFRYEEPGSAQVVSYPRHVQGTVRKQDDRRKKQRTERAERKAAEAQQRQEEIKRLKNLKKHEMQDRLAKITEIAGTAAPPSEVVDAILEGDFNPDEYDRRMAEAFGDDYYQEQDLDLDERVEAELEAELGRIADYSSGEEGGAQMAGFQAVHQRLSQASDSAAKQAEATARERSEVQRILEEYHKLDCEDHIGDLACRFHYKSVPAADYGLQVEDIMSLSDKDLNQVVGMKRLAPYRDDGGLRCEMPRFPVCLNVYDIGSDDNHWNSWIYCLGLGVFHSGVEIHGIEYAYGGHEYDAPGIFATDPKAAPGPVVFRESVVVGETDLSPEEVQQVVQSLGEEFRGNRYHLLQRNCNHFSSNLCRRLCGTPAPPWVNRLAGVAVMLHCLLPGTWVPALVGPTPSAASQTAGRLEEHQNLLGVDHHSSDSSRAGNRL